MEEDKHKTHTCQHRKRTYTACHMSRRNVTTVAHVRLQRVTVDHGLACDADKVSGRNLIGTNSLLNWTAVTLNATSDGDEQIRSKGAHQTRMSTEPIFDVLSRGIRIGTR